MGNGKRTGKSYRPSIPQSIMREEMMASTMKLSDVFDEVVGPQEKSEAELSPFGEFNQKVPTLVYGIINEPGNELSLSLKQWQVIQNMMEQATRLGYAYGEQARG